MEIKHIITVLPISLLFSLLFSACTTTPKTSVQPKKSKTIADIMQGQTGKSAVKSYSKKPRKWQTSPAYQANNISYTRSEAKELHGLFPRLPNPDLCMYIYPHLSSEQATIPGYSSCFSLYDQNQYALPSEMPAIRSMR